MNVERKNLLKQDAVSELLPRCEDAYLNLLCWESEHRENPRVTNIRGVHDASFVLGLCVNPNCRQVH